MIAVKLKYNKKLINKIVRNGDILAVALSDSNKFKKIRPLAGRRFNINCLFHQDRHPSMMIDCKNNKYYCLSEKCLKNGDIISFVMQMYDLDFLSAVEVLAYAFDVELPEKKLKCNIYVLGDEIRKSYESEQYKQLILLSDNKKNN